LAEEVVKHGKSKKEKNKHRNFVALLRPLLDSPEWLNLSSSAKLAYLYFKRAYVGHNNGEIRLYYSQMNRVLKSPATFSKAIKELEDKNWIKTEKQGGLFQRASIYSLSFLYDRFQ
jgi:hypothetical protein